MDRGYSWAIALACSLTHLCMFALVRSSGVLYVALLQTYGVSRGQAAWPFSLCMGVYCFTAPVAGVLNQYLSVRTVMGMGAGLVSLGACLCFTASSIHYVSLYLGLIHGLGMGMLFTMIPVIINQYFKRHKTTALGIAYSGGAISSFFFPVVFEQLLDTYGLRGTFLVVGGIVMHSFVAASLVRERSPARQERTGHQRSTLDQQTQPLFFTDVVAMIDDDEASKESDMTQLTVTKTLLVPAASNNNVPVISHQPMKKIYYNVRQQRCPPAESLVTVVKPTSDTKLICKIFAEIFMHVRLFFRVVSQPMFILICVSTNAFFLCFHTYLMVCVDMLVDQGVSEDRAPYVVSALSAADLVGRLGFGWVSDRGLVRRWVQVMANMAVVGTLLALVPLGSTLAAHAFMAALLGLVIGSTVPLFHALMAEYIAPSLFTIAVGASLFFYGFVMFLRPFLVGYFRDVIESYSYMFHILGGLLVCIAGLWLLEPLLAPDHHSGGRDSDHVTTTTTL